MRHLLRSLIAWTLIPVPLLSSISIVAAVFGGARPALGATSVVIPNLATAVEESGNFMWPWFLEDQTSSMRYQQVFSKSAFPSPIVIRQIAFRPDPFYGSAFSVTLPNVQVNLSTTAAEVRAMSLTFADNVGGDETIVHSGPLTLASNFIGPADGPKDFDVVLMLQTPFAYDPASGNLLLDVRNFDGLGTAFKFPLDGTFFSDETSVVTTASTGNVHMTDATLSDSTGLVARFSDVPEPTAVGVSALAIFSLRRRPARFAK